jgi:hypothetical protein
MKNIFFFIEENGQIGGAQGWWIGGKIFFIETNSFSQSSQTKKIFFLIESGNFHIDMRGQYDSYI